MINHDWVNYHACCLSYYIYVVPNLYRMKNGFTILSAKTIARIYFFLNLYTKSHKIRVPIGLVAEEI